MLAFGYLRLEKPSLQAFRQAFQSKAGKAALHDKVVLLHCTTEYPAPFEDVNLRAMATMREAFQLPIGYSDHTAGITIPIAAVACGATVIEKHVTLDRALPGPDHKASLVPEELKAMVVAIRDVEVALGNGIKEVAPSERKNLLVARRGLSAARAIKAGELFSEQNLTAKRPATGLSPFLFWEKLGQPADRDYAADEPIGKS